MNDIEKLNSDINIQEETTTDIVKETNNNIVQIKKGVNYAKI